jgi:transposase
VAEQNLDHPHVGVRLPDVAREALRVLAEQHEALKVRIAELKAKIVAWHRSNESSRRLATIPGIGPITASALAAMVPDAVMSDNQRFGNIPS